MKLSITLTLWETIFKIVALYIVRGYLEELKGKVEEVYRNQDQGQGLGQPEDWDQNGNVALYYLPVNALNSSNYLVGDANAVGVGVGVSPAFYV